MPKRIPDPNLLSKLHAPENLPGLLAILAASDLAAVLVLGQSLLVMLREWDSASISWVSVPLLLVCSWVYMELVPHRLAVLLNFGLCLPLRPLSPYPGRLIGGKGYARCSEFRSRFLKDGNTVAERYYNSIFERDSKYRKSIRDRLAFLSLVGISLCLPTSSETAVQSIYHYLSHLPGDAAELSLGGCALVLLGMLVSVINDLRLGDYEPRYYVFVGETSGHQT